MSMTEITQADIDAVKAYYYKTGFIADQRYLEQAFARHRMEERAAIVAWLRDDADHVVNADSPVYGADIIAEAIVECAVAIEAGEHLK